MATKPRGVALLCLLGRYLISLAFGLMVELSPHDPEMWLELEPIYTDALRNCRSSPIPSGNKHGVALRCLGLSSHVLHVKWVPPPFLWPWCHGWVGWGTKFFHDHAVSQGRHVLDRLGLPGSDESDLSASTR